MLMLEYSHKKMLCTTTKLFLHDEQHDTITMLYASVVIYIPIVNNIYIYIVTTFFYVYLKKKNLHEIINWL